MDYTFILTDKEVDYIGAMLIKQPYQEVAILLDKLRTQAKEQDDKVNSIVSPLFSPAMGGKTG